MEERAKVPDAPPEPLDNFLENLTYDDYRNIGEGYYDDCAHYRHRRALRLLPSCCGRHYHCRRYYHNCDNRHS